MPHTTIITALRVLGHFWLTEPQASDLDTLTGLPDLAATLPQLNQASLTELAVEYQRLFGFNLPPYESIFIDPSVMLMAPATSRVQRLYQQGGWLPPAGVRAGAADHLGLELLALADWEVAERPDLSRVLHQAHLALWMPIFQNSLARLTPAPFYSVLGELTLDLLLSTLPAEPAPDPHHLFPDLPPPPVYQGTDDSLFEPASEPEAAPTTTEGDPFRRQVRRLLKKRLLIPREAGLYLSREDIARLGQKLDLSVGLGDRFKMLETLFHGAAQYEQLPALLTALQALCTATSQHYQTLSVDYPAWQAYALAWTTRLEQTQAALVDFGSDFKF